MQKIDAHLDSEEELQQNPKDIALSIFRFRARRGAGVFYALFATLPLIQILIVLLKSPQYMESVSIVVAVLVFYIIARMAGWQRFHQMTVTIDRLEENEPEKNGQKLARILREGLVTPILPLIAIAVFDVIGIGVLSLAVGLAWIALAFYNDIQALSKRTKHAIFQRRIEDWLVILTLPLMVLLGVFHIGQTIELVVMAPVWLFAGIKSLYEAPQSLYTELSSKDDAHKTQDASKHADESSLSELASAGVLSNSARVGILIALQGVERITFTDLMLALKISKSSLNKSIKILEDAHYITVRKGFKATGRPRTFIQITEEGKTAIKDHLETMQQLTKKYLPK